MVNQLWCSLRAVNLFNAKCLFLYPLKTENLWFSDDFRGAEKETRVMKWIDEKLNSWQINKYYSFEFMTWLWMTINWSRKLRLPLLILSNQFSYIIMMQTSTLLLTSKIWPRLAVGESLYFIDNWHCHTFLGKIGLSTLYPPNF